VALIGRATKNRYSRRINNLRPNSKDKQKGKYQWKQHSGDKKGKDQDNASGQELEDLKEADLKEADLKDNETVS
jgi:hypothetical protein